MNPHDLRMLAELERQAGAGWTYAALAWAAQRRCDDAGALKCLIVLLVLYAAASERILSGAYLKSRPPGIRKKLIDDAAAQTFMVDRARATGERRGETLAAAAWEAGLIRANSRTAGRKRLAKWWNTEAKK